MQSDRANRRSIVVTGASSGIGRATALRLARNGWRVFAAVRKQADADSLVAEAAGGLETVMLDLADPASIAAAAPDVGARLGGRGLDALFNNAGMGMTAPVEYLSPEDLRRVFEINVFGQIAMTQAFLPLIRMAKGRIVNTGSVGDHLTPPFASAIAAPKAALASLTMGLRLELKSQGIRVILVEPGSINTPAVEKTLGEVETTIAALPADGQKLYAGPMRKLAAAFTAHETSGSPPDAVAEVVERALNARDPKVRYPAGKDAAKLTLLARFLPEKLLDRAVLKTFGLSE
ncbi:MAG TPA: SDR family NAD(P)-dependent oxidoreductase [Alphaproteobacteria bacterium]|jgi:NAD(P)-dependent dehydrogenase (short-subunit alcohol dehydrogenase family)|nr:SDR family NAD(P)-dependent oxidoreductase [Alphaproteobacteria bacterium]